MSKSFGVAKLLKLAKQTQYDVSSCFYAAIQPNSVFKVLTTFIILQSFAPLRALQHRFESYFK